MNAENASYRPHTSSKKIDIASDFPSLVKVMANVMDSRKQLRVVGLDCENLSSINSIPEPALLQLSNADKYCAIFQLSVMKRREKQEWEESTYARAGMTPENLALVNFTEDSDHEDLVDSLFTRFRPPFQKILKEVLEDPSILKVGVAVMDDAEHLDQHYGIICKGCLDIRYVAEEMGYKGGLSLDDLADKILGEKKLNLNKKTPWDSEELSQNQLNYAATDSLLGLLIFLKLNDQKITEKYSYLTRMNWDEKTYWAHSSGLWRKYIGQVFVYDKDKDIPKPISDWVSSLPEKGIKRSLRTVGSIVYESAIPPSLGVCGPSSDNRCIVCGVESDESFSVRPTEIIPVDYNISVPDSIDHNQYLCFVCLDMWHEYVNVFREELTNKCGAPWPAYDDERLKKAVGMAHKILFDRIGSSRKQRLREELCNMLGVTVTKHIDKTLDSHALLTVLSMDCWIVSDHGDFVREYFKRTYEETGEKRLLFLWCHRFRQKMKPRFLPHDWRTFYDHNLDFLVWNFTLGD